MALGLLTRDFGHGWNLGAIVIFVCLFFVLFLIIYFVANFGIVATKKTLSANCTKASFGEKLQKSPYFEQKEVTCRHISD
jgi:hypothetical protein